MHRKEHRNDSKHCSGCDRWLAFSSFTKNRSRWDGLKHRCKECEALSHQVVYARDKERILERERVYRANNKRARKNTLLKYNFGLSLEQYEEMTTSQNGLCAICGSASVLHVDHCHASLRVRGLLCFNCNTGLGKFNDSTERLRTAIAYLEAVRG
jgi:hypothetical protein